MALQDALRRVGRHDAPGYTRRARSRCRLRHLEEAGASPSAERASGASERHAAPVFASQRIPPSRTPWWTSAGTLRVIATFAVRYERSGGYPPTLIDGLDIVVAAVDHPHRADGPMTDITRWQAPSRLPSRSVGTQDFTMWREGSP
jgi:hypothetical protein